MQSTIKAKVVKKNSKHACNLTWNFAMKITMTQDYRKDQVKDNKKKL